MLYDHGGEFTKDFEALLEQVGTQATIIPVESHWRGGLVERRSGNDHEETDGSTQHL